MSNKSKKDSITSYKYKDIAGYSTAPFPSIIEVSINFIKYFHYRREDVGVQYNAQV